MEPLIQSFTKRLSPCSSCGKTDLSNPEFDHFWKPKEKKENELHNNQADRSGSGNAGGSSGENK
jgi:hypothetical protein